jgi:hypothetical protein
MSNFDFYLRMRVCKTPHERTEENIYLGASKSSGGDLLVSYKNL